MSKDISTIGQSLKIGIYGASHAEKIGVKISGFPKGMKIDFDKIDVQMARRAPGNIAYSTARKESDLPVILSGVSDDVTTGEMIEAAVFNTNQHSNDYNSLKHTPRPGHADYTAFVKYGDTIDMNGGGKFSGRLTAPLVFAGALCRQWLEQKNITVAAHVASIFNISDTAFDPVNADCELMQKLINMPFPVIDFDKKQQMLKAIDTAKRSLDSLGGTVECMVDGLQPGFGDSLFDGIEGKLSSYIFGIPAVKGLQFGLGFDATKIHGSENNDSFRIANGKVVTQTNNCGGILGGISNGMPLVFKVAFKPTPSIAQTQKSVDLDLMTDTDIAIKGRHDPCVVPRAAAVVEAATAICIADLIMTEQK